MNDFEAELICSITKGVLSHSGWYNQEEQVAKHIIKIKNEILKEIQKENDY